SHVLQPHVGRSRDRTPGPPGTYYRSSSQSVNYFWNTYDQVLLTQIALPPESFAPRSVLGTCGRWPAPPEVGCRAGDDCAYREAVPTQPAGIEDRLYPLAPTTPADKLIPGPSHDGRAIHQEGKARMSSRPLLALLFALAVPTFAPAADPDVRAK